MNQLWSDQNITEFVRGVLGCGCPDEVFEKIEVHKSCDLELPFSMTRINIGNTLLIYIARPNSDEELQDAIKAIVLTGKQDRDTHRFNRFRLVIAGDEKGIASDIVTGKFTSEIGEDEKMHLHFVKLESVDGL
jgi:predicted lipid carrier protein YhbT